MKYFLEIECRDDELCKEKCELILRQVSMFISESKLFHNSSSPFGISIIINPNIEKYKNVNEFNSKIYWCILNDSNVNLDLSSWRNFLLRCLHLDIQSIDEVTNILFLIMPNHIGRNLNENPEDTDIVKSFSAISPKYSLENVVMPLETKKQIDRALSLIKSKDLIFYEWGFKEIDPYTKTILCFYGSPGTGKTMCAHAIAKKLGKKILIASYASIESKWVGEGPKNLQKIFQDADQQDAVLFFDEADSFLSKRVTNAETGSDKHYNRMSNEMFQLLENYNGIIIFATNLVANFDKAFKSRILSFVEFRMPDYDARMQLIQQMIPQRVPLEAPLTKQDFGMLASRSENFSGREIRKAILTGLAESVSKNKNRVSFEDIERGFSYVKYENENIEKELGEHKNTQYLKDYLEEMELNTVILDICLIVTSYDSFTNTLTKKHLYTICKSLNIEMPDLDNFNKKVISKSDYQKIIKAGRANEVMRYLCELLAYMDIPLNDKIAVIQESSCDFCISNTMLYIDYLQLYEKIK